MDMNFIGRQFKSVTSNGMIKYAHIMLMFSQTQIFF